MSDYFEEIGHSATDLENSTSSDKSLDRLEDLAIINGIDMDIEVPEILKWSIAKLQNHEITADDTDDERECNFCHGLADNGDVYRVLSSCKHKFHKDCILLWLKKAIVDEEDKSCPECSTLNTIDPFCEQLRLFKQEEINRRQRQDNNANSMLS